MQTRFFPGEERGGGDHGWLRTRYSFSFADYFDPGRMGFGALRVINDDWIAPGRGFGTHGHRDMEIITIPLSGRLAHKDSSGAEGTICASDVQVMSAGPGVEHSEYNASESEPVTLFQIWIIPRASDLPFRYAEKRYDAAALEGAFTLLVGPEGSTGDEALSIYQDAYVSRGRFGAGTEASYKLRPPGNGVFALLIDGKAESEGQAPGSRDAVEISQIDGPLRFSFKEAGDLLLIEVPLR